jgi:hypothetical protein
MSLYLSFPVIVVLPISPDVEHVIEGGAASHHLQEALY